MGWSIGYDSNWQRDIGYGVPAICDHPGCGEQIHRGLWHVCGTEPYGGDHGCGLFFCGKHLYFGHGRPGGQLCERCAAGSEEPFQPTPDVASWIRHKLTHPRWKRWREETPQEVQRLQAAVMKALTICQPYAHLIMIGQKRVENRGWPTRYRGPMYIHAGKSRQWLHLDEDEDGTAYGIPIADMAFGAVVATARLIDCLHIDHIAAGDHDARYPWLRDHPHTNGPWCWILDEVTRVGPWPWRGAQGLFDIDVRALLRSAVTP